MARTRFSLVSGVWTSLGNGPFSITIQQTDPANKGRLFLGPEQDESKALGITPDRMGDQVLATNIGEEIFAKATASNNWVVVTDQ